MIESTKSYKTGDGTIHATIEAAQIHELTQLLDATPIDSVPAFLVNQKEEFIALLSLKTRKKRTPKAKPAPARTATPKP